MTGIDHLSAMSMIDTARWGALSYQFFCVLAWKMLKWLCENGYVPTIMWKYVEDDFINQLMKGFHKPIFKETHFFWIVRFFFKFCDVQPYH